MIEEIKNYKLVSPSLATSGQPSERQLEEIKENGFQAVINLGLLDQPYSLKNEKEKVESLGMQYVHIPIAFEAPKEGQFDQFCKAMDELKDMKIFLHCAANYRASSFAYLHGRIKEGWDEEKSETYIRKIWEPNPTWRAFLESVMLNKGSGTPEIRGHNGPPAGPSLP
jgi:protein tyrosine phosphatase (PTP) superfamily phosphohydrolase (DUF442 family)